jgi:bifunctional non-homologous end joining protein LigD
MKRKRDEDFVVVGYTRGAGKRERLGAIDVASFEDGVLQNRGKIGSGFDEGQIEVLLDILADKEIEGPVAEGEMVPAPRGRVHVRPEVVVRVRHDGFSDDGQVLHGVYLGIRDDVDASPPSAPRPPAPAEEEEGDGGREERRGGPPPEPPAFAITNPRKVLWPGEGITKADLVGYYEAIAPAMLPYLRDRPVMLVRYPDGILGKSFYQWNVPVGTPGWIRTYRLPGVQDQPVEVFLVDDERTLLHVANLAAIPIHVLASRASSPDDCDFLTMDFDVKGASLAEGITLARSLRDLCVSIGLEGFAKTSGQSGLHVLVPLGPGVGYPTARAMADLLGRMLCDRHPDIATMERIVAKRGPRVYVDTGQTGRTRTIVAPWSVRARSGATVSVPLAWSEVAPGLDPAAFTMRAAPERFRTAGDPMSGLLVARPDVPAAVERLGSMVQGERRRGGA